MVVGEVISKYLFDLTHPQFQFPLDLLRSKYVDSIFDFGIFIGVVFNTHLLKLM